jgi:hypothetical protein
MKVEDTSVEAIKLAHMFTRLDRLAKCINGKLHYDSYDDPDRPKCLERFNDGYYASTQAPETWAGIKVTDERIRQIKNGEATLRPNIVKLLRKAPASTIASLYKYQSKKITAIRKAAKAEVEEALIFWKKHKKQKKEQSDVMTGYVDDLVNRIKDSVSAGTTTIAELPMILEQFESTQGGTEGFVGNF